MPTDFEARKTAIRKWVDSQLSWEWVDLEEIVTEAAARIPPGMAVRRYEQSRKSQLRNRPVQGVGPPRPATLEQKILSGSRSIVNQLVNAMKARGYLEIEGPRGKRRARRVERRKPARCPVCSRFPDGTMGEDTPVPDLRPIPEIVKRAAYPDTVEADLIGRGSWNAV